MSPFDSRTVVPTVANSPYAGIGQLTVWHDRPYTPQNQTDPAQVSSGTAFYIGNSTVLTSYHVVSPAHLMPPTAEALRLISGATLLPIPFIDRDTQPPGTVTISNAEVQKARHTQDIALITRIADDPGMAIEITPKQVFGMDVFLNPAQALAVLPADEWDVRTAGYPGDKAVDLRNATPPSDERVFSLWEATGRLQHATPGITPPFYFSDVPDPNAPAAGVNGSLDLAGGQSGSPVWGTKTGDPLRTKGVAAGGVAVNGQSFLINQFEAISYQAFGWITTEMERAGDTQPGTVSNRITGTTGQDVIDGSPFKDVIRGLGTTGAPDELRGGPGDDVYEFSLFYGDTGIREAVTSADSVGGYDALWFPELAVDDIRLTRFGNNNLYVHFTDPQLGIARVVTLRDQFAGRPVEEIRLSDGIIPLTAGLELVGTDGNDRIEGTDFGDTLIGLDGADILYGYGGADTLIGGDGPDVLAGGDNSDLYVFGPELSDQIVDTGGANDAIHLTEHTLDDIRLVRSTGSGFIGVLDIYQRSTGDPTSETRIRNSSHFSDDGAIETLIFSDGSVLDLTGGLPLTGSDRRDDLRGTEFADHILGGAGNDFISALDGDDSLEGQTGNDNLSGGDGNDTYVFRPGDGQDGINETGDGGEDTILLDGFSLASLRIEDFFSFYYINLGADRIRVNTPAGTDPIERIAFAQGGGIDLTRPGALENVLPTGVTDTLGTVTSGNALPVAIEDLLANDSDGDADDVVSFAGLSDSVGGRAEVVGTQVVFTPDATFVGSAGFTYLLSDGTATVPVAVTLDVTPALPTNGDDTIFGSAAADTLDGLGGDDLIEGRGGSDVIDGGDGSDTASYALSEAGVEIDLGAGTATGGDAEGDDLGNIENLIGSGQSDRLTGSARDNRIDGGGGADLILLGDGGDDRGMGGAGNDAIVFGSEFDANDVVDGGAGTLDQLGLQGDYSAGVTFGAQSTVGIEMVVLLPGNITAFGGPGNETSAFDLTLVDQNVTAGGLLVFQANQLRAGEDFALDASAETDGAVFTYGGRGTEDLTGGQQDDAFFFGTGRWNAGDRVDGQGGRFDTIGLQGDYAGGITFAADAMTSIEILALLTNGDTRFGGGGATPFSYDLTMDDGNVAAGQTLIVSANTLGPQESLTFDGSAETDGRFRVFSGNGDDTIIGSDGADQISGRGGADVLTGHGGADAFLYTNLSDSTPTATDRITDFAQGDRINLAAIDAVAGTGANEAFTFIGDAAFSAAGQVRAENTVGNDWIVEADVNGDGAADLAIQLSTTGLDPIMAGDFVL